MRSFSNRRRPLLVDYGSAGFGSGMVRIRYGYGHGDAGGTITSLKNAGHIHMDISSMNCSNFPFRITSFYCHGRLFWLVVVIFNLFLYICMNGMLVIGVLWLFFRVVYREIPGDFR